MAGTAQWSYPEEAWDEPERGRVYFGRDMLWIPGEYTEKERKEMYKPVQKRGTSGKKRSGIRKPSLHPSAKVLAPQGKKPQKLTDAEKRRRAVKQLKIKENKIKGKRKNLKIRRT